MGHTLVHLWDVDGVYLETMHSNKEIGAVSK